MRRMDRDERAYDPHGQSSSSPSRECDGVETRCSHRRGRRGGCSHRRACRLQIQELHFGVQLLELRPNFHPPWFDRERYPTVEAVRVAQAEIRLQLAAPGRAGRGPRRGLARWTDLRGSGERSDRDRPRREDLHHDRLGAGGRLPHTGDWSRLEGPRSDFRDLVWGGEAALLYGRYKNSPPPLGRLVRLDLATSQLKVIRRKKTAGRPRSGALMRPMT